MACGNAGAESCGNRSGGGAPRIQLADGREGAAWHPRMAQEPVDVRIGAKGALRVRRLARAQAVRAGATEHARHRVAIERGRLVRKPLPRPLDRAAWPEYYANLTQAQDYAALQDMFDSTVAGAAVDAVRCLALAGGVRPVLRPLGRPEPAAEQADLLEECRWMADELAQVEAQIRFPDPVRGAGVGGAGSRRTGLGHDAGDASGLSAGPPLRERWAGAFLHGAMFGRSMALARVDPGDNEVTVSRGGTMLKFRGIPKAVELVHPRDMGFVRVDPLTNGLLCVQIGGGSRVASPGEMVFWEWDGGIGAVLCNRFYGASMFHRSAGAARALRRVVAGSGAPRGMVDLYEGQILSEVGLPRGLVCGNALQSRGTARYEAAAWTRLYARRYRDWFLRPITAGWYGRLAATLAAQDRRWRDALERVEVHAGVVEFGAEGVNAQIRGIKLLESTSAVEV